MRLHYDQRADALYLLLNDAKIVDSEEVQPGVVLDFDDRGEVVGVEILFVKRRMPDADPSQLQFEVI